MSDCCGCGKTLEVERMQARQRRVLYQVLAINLVTFAMMMGAAWYSGSASLLSGSLDNLGDSLTYALSLAVVGASIAAKARVAMLKALLILCAAIAVAVGIGWKLVHPHLPLFESMGIAAVLNLGANLVCLRLLWPYRAGDINLASAWACSLNDVYEGCAVILAALAVWLFDAGWPDLLIATALLLLFLRSAWKVARAAWRELRGAQVLAS